MAIGLRTQEEILISHEEYLLGKYQSTVTRGSDRYAIVQLKDGEIDPSSYTDRYQKEHGLGKYAKKDSSQKRKNGRSEKKKNSNCLMKIILAPFKVIWWLFKFILKTILTILTFGLISKLYNEDDKD